ncbi:hypothetical protein HDV02_005069 [Globomyces sp. JEL0801]|nr:hypothetical protein HDV02_005069 [Globomyces sp. JEL0801]
MNIALVISILTALVQSIDPITFKSSGNFAITSLGNTTTTISTHPAPGQDYGAQLLYTKSNLDPKTVSLAAVYLNNDALLSQPMLLQSGFNTLTQTCSCYWIDARDLLVLNPTLKTSNQFYLTMISTGYTIKSGLITIDFHNTPTTSEVEAIPIEVPSPTPVINVKKNGASDIQLHLLSVMGFLLSIV